MDCLARACRRRRTAAPRYVLIDGREMTFSAEVTELLLEIHDMDSKP
jgi:hypothetical protein